MKCKYHTGRGHRQYHTGRGHRQYHTGRGHRQLLQLQFMHANHGTCKLDSVNFIENIC